MTGLTTRLRASVDLRWQVRIALFLAIVIYFGLTGSGFFAAGNVFSMVETFALIALVAGGLTMTMIAGEFDLSVGALVATSGVVALKAGSHDVVVGILIAVVVGLLVGLLNGMLTAWLDVPSMVVTVGTLVFVTGLGFQLAGGNTNVSSANYQVTVDLTKPILSVLSDRSVITIAVLVVLTAIMALTRSGRDVVAVGSDRRAAAAAGVPRRMPIVAVFVLSGLCASLAGALLAFSQASATPGFNSTLLLQAVSAAILGGVALTGGKGSIRGAAFGAIVLATLNSGLSLVSASGVAINLANGGLLLAIVLLDARAPYLERRIAAGRARIGGPSPLPQS